MTPSFLAEYSAIGTCGRQVTALTIPTFDDVAGVVLPSLHFVGLLCCDARGVSDRQMIDVATVLFERGLAYLCAWGPDCRRVRNLFEAAAMVWNSQAAVLSVHLYDGLDDALDYFLNIASPAVDYMGTCQSGLILNVGAAPWAQYIYEQLAVDSAATARR